MGIKNPPVLLGDTIYGWKGEIDEIFRGFYYRLFYNLIYKRVFLYYFFNQDNLPLYRNPEQF